MKEPTIYRMSDKTGDEFDAYFAYGNYSLNGYTSRYHPFVEVVVDCGGFFDPWMFITLKAGYWGERRMFINTKRFPDMCELLERNGLAVPTGIERQFDDHTYPLYEFTDKFFDESRNYEDEEE